MKKSLYRPKKSELRSGNVLPIYTDYKEEEGFEGNALLIKYEPSRHVDELPYIRAVNKSGSGDINWSFQRWLIRFVDGNKAGFKTHRYIGYFKNLNSYNR